MSLKEKSWDFDMDGDTYNYGNGDSVRLDDVFDAVQKLKKHIDCNVIDECHYLQIWREECKDNRVYQEWLIDEVFGTK